MKPTSQELTARIRDMILSGEFSSGQHLREAALADQFSVSRTPVRAALAANEKDGLVEYNPNRGYIVRAFHVRDIAEKYLVAGETQDTAFLFVPSESIFAAIHENFEAIVQKAHRSRIVIVSPSLLLLSIQVLQALLKDQRMREQAHVIQGEVVRLMEDLGRLDDRVRKLQSHFVAAQKDVEMIITSSDKLVRRGERIEAMDFDDQTAGDGIDAPAEQPRRSVESRTGMLKLRVVDED